MLKFYTMSFIA